MAPPLRSNNTVVPEWAQGIQKRKGRFSTFTPQRKKKMDVWIYSLKSIPNDKFSLKNLYIVISFTLRILARNPLRGRR